MEKGCRCPMPHTATGSVVFFAELLRCVKSLQIQNCARSKICNSCHRNVSVIKKLIKTLKRRECCFICVIYAVIFVLNRSTMEKLSEYQKLATQYMEPFIAVRIAS